MAVPHAKGPRKRQEKPKTGASPLTSLKKLPGGRWFWLLLVFMTLPLVGWVLFGDKGVYHLYQLRTERERLLQTNFALKDENDRLMKIIDRLQNDQEFIEDTIRKELNFIKKNEIIYQLEPEVGSGPKVTQAPALGPPPSPPAKTKRTGH